jgi:peroxiredoxin
VWVCSMQHIPSFLQHAEELKQKGVEQVVCVSVNDVFVMDAWCKSLAADGILMVVCTALLLLQSNCSFRIAHGAQSAHVHMQLLLMENC